MFDFQFEGDNTITLIDRPPIINRELQPVWAEELNNIGADRFFDYPKKAKSPLLWKAASRYFYKGLNVFDVTWIDCDTAPKINPKECLFSSFEEIDIQALCSKNAELLQRLCLKSFDVMRRAVEGLPASTKNLILLFSGGKDSTVAYDLFKKAFMQGMFKGLECFVSYTDTGMEFEQTTACFEHYARKDSKLFEFVKNKPEMDPLLSWDKIGYPTRCCRWCCKVCKSAPQVQTFKHRGESLLVQGVRSFESARRSKYPEIMTGEMENRLVSPLLSWSSFEVWLYILGNRLFFNRLYKQGLRRVGCVLCPCGFSGKNYLDQKFAPKKYKGFRKIVEKSLKNPETFKKGDWVGTNSGKTLASCEPKIIVGKRSAFFLQDSAQYNWEWLKVVGLQPKMQFVFEDADQRKRQNQYILKAAYCIGCGVCASFCKFDAISFVEKEDGTKTVSIAADKCKHCFACRFADGRREPCFVRWRQHFSLGETKKKLKNEGRTDLLSMFEEIERG